MTENAAKSGPTDAAVWYFVAASVLLAAGVFALTMTEGFFPFVVACVAFPLGGAVAIAGAVVARRERRRRTH